MEVYILRHGIAEVRRPGGGDPERRLTKEGQEKLRRVLESARAAGVRPTLVLTSPYIRAVETAEIAVRVLGYKGRVAPSDALLPSSSAPAVWRLIREHSEEAAILLAGHEPLLGEAASYLLGAPRVLVDLKKGAMLRIDLDPMDRSPRGVLQWFLTAKLAATSAAETGG